jgi:hypothetical protein
MGLQERFLSEDEIVENIVVGKQYPMSQQYILASYIGQPNIDHLLDDSPPKTRLVHSHSGTIFCSRRLHSTHAHPESIAKLHRCRHLVCMPHEHPTISILTEIVYRYGLDPGPFLSA